MTGASSFAAGLRVDLPQIRKFLLCLLPSLLSICPAPLSSPRACDRYQVLSPHPGSGAREHPGTEARRWKPCGTMLTEAWTVGRAMERKSGRRTQTPWARPGAVSSRTARVSGQEAHLPALQERSGKTLRPFWPTSSSIAPPGQDISVTAIVSPGLAAHPLFRGGELLGLCLFVCVGHYKHQWSALVDVDVVFGRSTPGSRCGKGNLLVRGRCLR
jgi:hypothetical protein